MTLSTAEAVEKVEGWEASGSVLVMARTLSLKAVVGERLETVVGERHLRGRWP